MEENLKGRTLLIGREPVNNRLLVSINIGNQIKPIAIGLPNSVPITVSKCMAAQGIAHCKIDISPDGLMTLTNLKPQNVTYVNGSEIVKKVILEDSNIGLGRGGFSFNLKNVLTTVSNVIKGSAPQQPQSPVNILPLKQVWEGYDSYLMNQRIANGKFAAMASASGLFTIGSVVISAIPHVNPNWRYFMYGIALILIIVTLVKRYKNATRLPIEQKEKQQEFQSRYVCPACHHFVGNQPYDLLRQNKQCPYCRRGWTEK